MSNFRWTPFRYGVLLGVGGFAMFLLLGRTVAELDWVTDVAIALSGGVVAALVGAKLWRDGMGPDPVLLTSSISIRTWRDPIVVVLLVLLGGAFGVSVVFVVAKEEPFLPALLAAGLSALVGLRIRQLLRQDRAKRTR